MTIVNRQSYRHSYGRTLISTQGLWGVLGHGVRATDLKESEVHGSGSSAQFLDDRAAFGTWQLQTLQSYHSLTKHPSDGKIVKLTTLSSDG